MLKQEILTINQKTLFDENISYKHLLTNILCSLEENFVIVTDNNFQIIISNFKNAKIGENILAKLNLKNCAFENLKDNLIVENENITYEIKVKKNNSSETNSTLFIFYINDISKKEKYKDKFFKLIDFLNHELKTPLISHITALNLILKNKENLNLLPEILYSNKLSYRILNNCLEELTYEKNKLSLMKNYFSLNDFTEQIQKDCKEFLSNKNNKLEFINKNETKIYADENLLKKAIINLLFQINERCKENTKILVTTNVAHQHLRFQFIGDFKFEKNLLQKDIITEKNHYEKLAYDNGLFIAKTIVELHNGKFVVQNFANYTKIKMILPN